MLLLHITKLVCIRNTRLVYSLYAYIKLDSIVICYVSYLPSCVRIYVLYIKTYRHEFMSNYKFLPKTNKVPIIVFWAKKEPISKALNFSSDYKTIQFLLVSFTDVLGKQFLKLHCFV